MLAGEGGGGAEAKADNRYWDSVIVIAITMFQIQCHNVGVCRQRGMAGFLSGGERRQGGVLLLDVQEAGQWEVRGGADEGGTEQSTSQEKEE